MAPAGLSGRFLPRPLALSWLVAALFGASSCSSDADTLRAVANGEATVTGEGVLLIVVDGLRWDHTSLAGYDRRTTPFLQDLAKRSIVFDNAWSPTPSQLGAHVAILSGCDPSIALAPPVFGSAAASLPLEPAPRSAESTAWFLPEELTLLSQPFLGAGWNTAAFVDDPMIAELRGFDRGFREFIEFGGDPAGTDREIGVFGVGRRFVRWLNAQSISDNWFAYVHMNDLERVWVEGENTLAFQAIEPLTRAWTPRPELERVPPLGYTEPLLHTLPPSRAGTGEPLSLAEYELRYDRGICAIDASLQRLLGHAGEFGREELLTIVIVGSFGTGLGENGMYLRAGLATEEDLHVPLVIKPSKRLAESLGLAPDGGGKLRRSESLASSIDLMPTLVDLLGLRSPKRLHGISLVPVLKDRDREVRSRIFATSTAVPGDAVIDRTGIYSRYSAPAAVDRDGVPSEGALSRLREVWTPVGGQGMTIGSPGIGPSEGQTMGDKRAILDRWKSLILAERRAIHFGRGTVDIEEMEKIVGLQAMPWGPQEDH